MSALSLLSADIEALIERARSSVVAVEHGRGHGSGVVVSQDGYVLTNAHVVGTERSLRVRFADGEELAASLVGRDAPSDLAVIRVPASGLGALALHETRRVRVGQIVLALGNPLRLEGSASLGIVSALDRSLPGPRGRALEGLIQTDAAINPGSSGGPLLDADGCVVGINTAMMAMASAIGFAIPAYTATWVTAMLIKHGAIRRPWIGVAASGVELTRRTASDSGRTRGVRVHEVVADSPAAHAGV
ncbi:MAG TPA: trypsin-like peptidase domain-containing protein, partial [Polyangiaceae bacterium]|nr:trypsin-like peptidase domain-containing protein [Polyangiaceae bacterium]